MKKIMVFILLTLFALTISGCEKQTSFAEKFVNEWDVEKQVVRNAEDIENLKKRKDEVIPVIIVGIPTKGEELVSDRLKGNYEYAFVREIGESKERTSGFINKIPGTNISTVSSSKKWRDTMVANLTEPTFQLGGFIFSVDLLKSDSFFQSNTTGLRKLTNEEISKYLKDNLQRNVDDGYYYQDIDARYSYYVLDSKEMKFFAYVKNGEILFSQDYPIIRFFKNGSTETYFP